MSYTQLTCLLALLICASMAGAVEPAPPAPRSLFDFESDDELGRWTQSAVSGELVAEHATHGKKAVKLTYKSGGSFLFTAQRDKFNLTGYTHLRLDVFSPGAATITFKLKSNNETAKWQKEIKLQAGQNELSIPFDTTGIDPSQLDYINLFVANLAAELVLHVDHIRAEAVKANMQVAPTGPADAGEKVLFDFESKEELGRWNLNGVAGELSQEHVTRGKHSAMLVYKPAPGLQTFMLDAGKKKLDLSGCTHLYIDFFAPVNLAISVKLKSSESKKVWQREFSLEPEASSIVIPLEGIGLDLAKVDYINLFMSAKAETIIYLDNIRGVRLQGGAVSNQPLKPELPDDEQF